MTGKLLWYGGGASGSVALPPKTLLPETTETIDLAQWAGGKIPAKANWGTILLSYRGRSGDLVPISFTQVSSGRYSMQTPFTEGGAPLWKGSMWQVDAMHDTLLVAGNAGDKPTTTALTLVYNGGKGSYTMERFLQPGEQIWADVGSIIGNQTPDKDGHMISQAVTAGSYEVRDVDNPIHGKVYEGKLILDKTYGHAAYGCGVCCGYRWVAFDPASYSGAVGNSTADFLLAGNACTGLSDDVTYSGYSWNSSNTAVATVQAGVFTTLVGAGTASGSAYATVPGTNIRQGCPDAAFLAMPQSITAYAVHVTNVNLSSDQVQVTLQGPSGNTGTLIVSWNGPGGNPDIANESVGPGSYTFNPPLDSSHLAAGQYTGVKATWHSVSSSYSTSFDVLGVYEHTQYNTPAESGDCLPDDRAALLPLVYHKPAERVHKSSLGEREWNHQ